jgi:hypothetical protein
MKPECISAASERARARAARSLGQIGIFGWTSATYSIIASESHTTILPSCNDGHLPAGEKRNISAPVFSCAIGITISSKAMPKWRIKIHGRNDQDE